MKIIFENPDTQNNGKSRESIKIVENTKKDRADIKQHFYIVSNFLKVS